MPKIFFQKTLIRKKDQPKGLAFYQAIVIFQ